MRVLPLCPLLGAALLGLAGCELTEPYDRIGTWRPTRAPETDIAAMVVDPHDLVRGVDYAPGDATAATAAVERYRTGRVRVLPDTSTLSISSSGSGGGGGNAPAAATGGTAQAAQ